MKNILFYTNVPKLESEILNICSELQLKLKVVFDCDMALHFLNNREYDLLIVDDSIPFNEQERLANNLWSKSPTAPFLLYVQDVGTRQYSKNRLLGVEIIGPLNANQNLREFLKNFVLANQSNNIENILYVEDLDSPREILSMFLKKLSTANIDECSSAKEALEKLNVQGKSYTCVITDIKMPELNGCDLVKLIRANPKTAHLPIIVLTAYGTVDWLIDCLKAGASGFLVKPPKSKDLMSELNRVRRINQYRLSPRLTNEQDAEQLRDILTGRS
jgi:CheY-like chemotaxis protein